ncbi:MAG: sulfotransferase family protein, partial [Candidatus Aminicenantales bacterium]
NRNEHRSPGHPLATGSLSNTVKVLWGNRGVDGRFLLRALNILLSNLALTPFRLLEISKWADAVERTSLREPPIFIIGTWRSGTTYLHNLMAQDGGLGFVSTLQAFCPDLCIEGAKVLKPIFKRLLPKKRPMDNMAMSLEYPQEEEYAMGNLSPYSFYLGYSLPRRMASLFDLLSFGDGRSDVLEAWKQIYIRILKKATLVMNGRRLVIKNPLNTSRIPVLLDMFPEAQFIFLYRNPYVVYPSLLHTFSRMIGAYQLESMTTQEIEDNVLSFYEKMMRAYWSTKETIPPENLVEVRFEEFEEEPLAVLERIYRELRLPGFGKARDRFEKYIASQGSYEKNQYAVNRETVDRISRSWRFAIERLGYSPPE